MMDNDINQPPQGNTPLDPYRNETLLMDVGDSILHEVSGMSAFQDTLSSVHDHGKLSCSKETSETLSTQEVKSRLASGDNPKQTKEGWETYSNESLLEDISGSILNYSGMTDSFGNYENPDIPKKGASTPHKVGDDRNKCDTDDKRVSPLQENQPPSTPQMSQVTYHWKSEVKGDDCHISQEYDMGILCSSNTSAVQSEGKVLSEIKLCDSIQIHTSPKSKISLTFQAECTSPSHNIKKRLDFTLNKDSERIETVPASNLDDSKNDERDAEEDRKTSHQEVAAALLEHECETHESVTEGNSDFEGTIYHSPTVEFVPELHEIELTSEMQTCNQVGELSTEQQLPSPKTLEPSVKSVKATECGSIHAHEHEMISDGHEQTDEEALEQKICSGTNEQEFLSEVPGTGLQQTIHSVISGQHEVAKVHEQDVNVSKPKPISETPVQDIFSISPKQDIISVTHEGAIVSEFSELEILPEGSKQDVLSKACDQESISHPYEQKVNTLTNAGVETGTLQQLTSSQIPQEVLSSEETEGATVSEILGETLGSQSHEQPYSCQTGKDSVYPRAQENLGSEATEQDAPEFNGNSFSFQTQEQSPYMPLTEESFIFHSMNESSSLQASDQQSGMENTNVRNRIPERIPKSTPKRSYTGRNLEAKSFQRKRSGITPRRASRTSCATSGRRIPLSSTPSEKTHYIISRSPLGEIMDMHTDSCTISSRVPNDHRISTSPKLYEQNLSKAAVEDSGLVEVDKVSQVVSLECVKSNYNPHFNTLEIDNARMDVSFPLITLPLDLQEQEENGNNGKEIGAEAQRTLIDFSSVPAKIFSNTQNEKVETLGKERDLPKQLHNNILPLEKLTPPSPPKEDLAQEPSQTPDRSLGTVDKTAIETKGDISVKGEILPLQLEEMYECQESLVNDSIISVLNKFKTYVCLTLHQPKGLGNVGEETSTRTFDRPPVSAVEVPHEDLIEGLEIHTESFDVSFKQEFNVTAQDNAEHKVLEELELPSVVGEIYSGVGEGIFSPENADSNREAWRHGAIPKVRRMGGPLIGSEDAVAAVDRLPRVTQDDDIVDYIFHSSDPGAIGFVQASVLADRLAQMLAELQPRWMTETLRAALCQDGENQQLDLQSYHLKLHGWLLIHSKDVSIITEGFNLGEAVDTAAADEPSDIVSVTPVRTAPSRQQVHRNTPLAYHPSLRTPFPEYFATPRKPPEEFYDDESIRHWARRNLIYEDNSLIAVNRRSTLLPWWLRGTTSGGAGGGEGDIEPGDLQLDMSRPPSPIAPPAISVLCNTSDNLKNSNTNFDDDAPFKDVDVEKMNRINQLGEPHPQLNYIYGSIVDDSCTTEPDPEKLRQEVLELEHTKRRLTEEKVELNHQITTSEEANSSLRQHCQQLEHALNSLQHQLAGTHRMEEEIEELRLLLDTERDEKGHLLTRVTCLEKENTALCDRLKDVHIKLYNVQEDLENSNLREAQLVEDHKAKVTVLAQKVHQYKTEALQEAEDNKLLTESLEELRKIIEALQEEKNSLEEQLVIIKGKLAAMTSCSEHEISGDVEDEGLPEILEPSRSNLSKLPWGSSMYSSPFPTDTSHKSIQDTPQSIHSEIQTMSDNVGSLPFCEKSGEGLRSTSLSPDDGNGLAPSSQSSKDEQFSLTLISNMLNRWLDWDSKYLSLMQQHVVTHFDELLKMEKEFQNIVKKRQGFQSTPSSRKSSNSFCTSPTSRRSSRKGSLDLRSLGFVVEAFNDMQGSQISAANLQRTPGPIAPVVPESRSSRNRSQDSRSQRFCSDSFGESPVNQSMPNQSPRSSGTSVSHLISVFEQSSRASSPAVSERSDRSGLVDYNSSVARDLKLESESASTQGDFVSPVSGERKCLTPSPPAPAPYNFLRDSKILNRSKLVMQNIYSEELGNHFSPDCRPGNSALENQHIPRDTEEVLVDPLPLNREIGEVLDSGFEQDGEFNIITAGTHPLGTNFPNSVSKVKEDKYFKEFMEIDKKSNILDGGLDEEDCERDTQKAVDENAGTSLKRKLLASCSTASSAGSTSVEIDMNIEWETSKVFNLMKKVKDQEVVITTLKRQVTETEEQKETWGILITRLHRLVMEVSGSTFTWTVGVRKEWLASVPVTREDEGTTDPLRTPDPLDDWGPLSTTHSREEIESLIHTRCDLGSRLSREDFSTEYVAPENLAIEIERELLALKLHLVRCRAILLNHQNLSHHASRSEVSTPPVSTFHHVQGVEAGVEADLCGPTCIPRPCDSTATQTPASPISISPECEASGGEEATGSVCGSNDGVSDDLLPDDHRPLTPQHRPLYQRMSVSEEEVDEESGCGRDMAAAVSSDHAIYAPKPTYDQLDQYSSYSKRNEREKQRRSGLATISPKDPDVAPLSPPPSLDKEEEEKEIEVGEDEKEEAEEGEPELPSTPESNPSSASDPPLFPPGEVGATGEDRTKLLPQVNVIPTTCSAPNTPTAPTFDSATPRSASAPWAPSESLLDPDRPRSASWTASSTVFPSLQDAHLRALGVSVQDSIPNENLSAQEIENKFKQLSLAFKTDRITLKQRVEVLQRQMDIAETNFDRELKLLESSILALRDNVELVDAIMQIRKHLDVLTISSTSLLSASEDANITNHFDVDAVMDEVWGAVQQEWRVSRALEVLLLHVENVKRLYENDHQELEEMRRMLNEHQIEYPATTGGGGSGQSTTTDSALGSIRIRALSLAGVSKQQSQESGNRRISLGPNASRNLRDFLGGRGSQRRASLMPDLGLFHQEIAAAAVAAAASKASKEKLEEKRHSTNGMLENSITEEGSESGDEASGNTRPATGDSSPTATSGSKITSFPFDSFTQALQDSDQSSNEDNSSSFHTPATVSQASSNLGTGFDHQSQHWPVHGFADFLGWLRGWRWPFSPQQTYEGARCLFISSLLLLAVFFFLLTVASSDEVQEPCHPGWTTIHHLLHRFVTIRKTGESPY